MYFVDSLKFRTNKTFILIFVFVDLEKFSIKFHRFVSLLRGKEKELKVSFTKLGILDIVTILLPVLSIVNEFVSNNRVCVLRLYPEKAY